MILFWEETTFTQEMAIIEMAGVFAEWAGPGWMVGLGIFLVWSSAAGRFTIAARVVLFLHHQ